MTNIYTSNFYTKTLIAGIKELYTENPVYLYCADGLSDVVNADNLENTVENEQNTIRQMLFGKKLKSTDFFSMVDRNSWTSGTVYDQYDHKDPNLFEKAFYVIASNRAVYKCLNNNHGAHSTVEPSSLLPLSVKTADGYVWRYLYRLSTQDMSFRTTSTLVPVRVEANTVSAAVPGSIDFISVEAGGANYDTTHAGGYIGQVLSTTLFNIDPSASAVDGIYEQCAMYISNGPGAGQISVIDEYYSNATGRYIKTLEPLNSLTISSQYDIAPSVVFTGNGEDAVARAIVTNGEISAVDVIAKGKDYTWCDVSIVSKPGYGSGAIVLPIIAPQLGHGADVETELFSRNLLISTEFAGSESATIPVDVKFSRYGLVKNVKQWANNELDYTANTFNNTVFMETVQINGMFARGDELSIVGSDDVAVAEVLAVTANSATVSYVGPDPLFSFNTVVNQNGVSASISSVEQPDVYLTEAQVLSFGEINTITRSANTTETINIILKV